MKIIIYLATLLMVAGLASAATMSRSMPDRVAPGETLTVSFAVSGMEIGKEVALSEVIPAGWSVKDWSVSGAKEAKADITYKKKSGNEHQWSFTASTTNPAITYTTVVPSAASGSYEFDAVYMLPPANMNNLKKTLTVRVITCGDGVCEGAENSDNCAADCPKPTPPPTQEEKAEEAKLSPAWAVLAAVIVILAAAYFVLIRKKKR
jgi:hypothetical protein